MEVGCTFKRGEGTPGRIAKARRWSPRVARACQNRRTEQARAGRDRDSRAPTEGIRSSRACRTGFLSTMGRATFGFRDLLSLNSQSVAGKPLGQTRGEKCEKQRPHFWGSGRESAVHADDVAVASDFGTPTVDERVSWCPSGQTEDMTVLRVEMNSPDMLERRSS